MSEEKLIEIFFNNIEFDIVEYLDAELNDIQKRLIDDATFILKENIIGGDEKVQKLGGNLKKNDAKFKTFSKNAEALISDDKYKSVKKDLKEMLKDYLKKLSEVIENTCIAIIPVKEMPFVDVIFRSTPRLVKMKKKFELLENVITYYGEIKCVISRTTIYGKMKDADPLFAPLMGNLDLKGFKLDDVQKGPKAQIFPYVSAIIESLDATTTKSQLAKYHEGYQRHGEPICDHLMKDKELLEGMSRVTSGLDSKRLSDLAVCAIAIPHSGDDMTLVLVMDESDKPDKFSFCFGGFLRFAANCCDAPSSRRAGMAAQAQQMTQAAQAQASPSGPGVGGLVRPQGQAVPGGTMVTPGGQQLTTWTAEQLSEESQKRGGGIPAGMESWDEGSLQKMASERGSGVPEGMEVWNASDLEKLAKERQGQALNIPEWKEDSSMLECTNCGYALRKGWDECPICNTKVKSTQTTQPAIARIPDKKSVEPSKPAEPEKKTDS